MTTARSEQISHITNWQASGLSMAAYCREASLPYHRFSYWVQQDRLRQQVAGDTEVLDLAEHFTCLPVERQMVMPAGMTLGVTLPSGMQLQLGRSCSSQELLAVVQAVLA